MNKLMNKNDLKKVHEIELEILDEIVRICDKNNLTYFLTYGTLLGAVRHKGFIPWDDDLDIGMPREDYEKFLECCKNELSNKFLLDNKDTNKKYYLNFTKIRKIGTVMEQDFQINYNGPKGIWIDIFPYDDAIYNKGKVEANKKKIKLIFSILHYKSGFFLGNKLLWIKKILGFIAKPINNKMLLEYQDRLMKKDYKKNCEYIISYASEYGVSRELVLKQKYFPVKKIEFEGKKYSAPNCYKDILINIYGDYMKLPPKEERRTHNPVRLEF